MIFFQVLVQFFDVFSVFEFFFIYFLRFFRFFWYFAFFWFLLFFIWKKALFVFCVFKKFRFWKSACFLRISVFCVFCVFSWGCSGQFGWILLFLAFFTYPRKSRAWWYDFLHQIAVFLHFMAYFLISCFHTFVMARAFSSFSFFFFFLLWLILRRVIIFCWFFGFLCVFFVIFLRFGGHLSKKACFFRKILFFEIFWCLFLAFFDAFLMLF